MALPLENTFEGGTSGTAISAANSGGASGNAFDVVAATAPNFSNANPAHGALGMALQASGQVEWTSTSMGTPTTVFGRCYVFLTAAPLVVTAIAAGLTPTSATARQFNVRIAATTPKLSNLSKAGTVVTSTTTLSLNTLYRVEFKMVTVASGSCTIDCVLYLGDSPTPLETMTQATGTGASTDTSINQMWWGSANNVAANVVFIDDVQVNATGFPGPYVTRKQPPFHESLAMANRPRLSPRPRLPLAAWR